MLIDLRLGQQLFVKFPALNADVISLYVQNKQQVYQRIDPALDLQEFIEHHNPL